MFGDGRRIISTELTTAYNITNTETTYFVSLNSYDLSDYHLAGPDEKTKRVKALMETIVRNTVQIADILECVNREYDAHMVRVSVALAITGRRWLYPPQTNAENGTCADAKLKKHIISIMCQNH